MGREKTALFYEERDPLCAKCDRADNNTSIVIKSFFRTKKMDNENVHGFTQITGGTLWSRNVIHFFCMPI